MSEDPVSGKENITSVLNGYQGQRVVRLFAPVYGPALLLVLAGCHRAGHIGPKPNTGAPEMAPFIAGEIDGLDGPETMSFAAADERVYADLAIDGVQPDQAVYFRGETETSAGSAAGLDLRAYAHLIGTGFADHLLGDSEMNIIVGEGGDDLIEGRGGADQLYGAYGQDRLHGGSGEDKLYGSAGDDRLLGGWQADRLDGARAQIPRLTGHRISGSRLIWKPLAGCRMKPSAMLRRYQRTSLALTATTAMVTC